MYRTFQHGIITESRPTFTRPKLDIEKVDIEIMYHYNLYLLQHIGLTGISRYWTDLLPVAGTTGSHLSTQHTTAAMPVSYNFVTV